MKVWLNKFIVGLIIGLKLYLFFVFKFVIVRVFFIFMIGYLFSISSI